MRELCLVLPTNEPSTFSSIFMKGIDNLLPAKDLVVFNINFQEPWDDKSAESAVSELESKGFLVHYKLSPKYKFTKPKVPFNKIRNDTVIDDDCKYYALMDDDMQFRGPSPRMNKNAGEQYLQIIHYMDTHPKCGITIIAGPLLRRIPKNNIGS